MWDMIAVGIILCAAAGFVVYRLFFKSSCGCANSENCSAKKADSEKSGTGCHCQK